MQQGNIGEFGKLITIRQCFTYSTAHLQGNECTRETRAQLSSNSHATLVYTQSYSQSSIQQNPVKITNN